MTASPPITATVTPPPLATNVPPVVVPSSADPPSPPRGHVVQGRLLDRYEIRLPAWLVSLMIHLIVLLTLAMLTVPARPSFHQVLWLRTDHHDQATIQPIVRLEMTDPVLLDNSEAREAPVESPLTFPNRLTVRSPLESAESESPALDRSVQQMLHNAEAAAGSSQPMISGGGLQGRLAEGRQHWGTVYGATPASEAAVELALQWLADHQRRDGSWSFSLNGPPCNGRCQDHRHNPEQLPAPPTAATGLALLAFLGAGYTHESGRYAEHVDRGLYYLRGQMREVEIGADLQMGSMYGHGIATLAVAEAAAMTGDQELRGMTAELTRFVLAARHEDGSWGYTPGTPGDITLTAWQIMALQGAHRLKIQLPSDVFARTKQYVDGLSPDQGLHFGYRKPEVSKTPTAIGITLQLYLGRPPHNAAHQAGLRQLSQWGALPNNVYHNYYATLALHHSRSDQWEQWHQPLRDYLIRTQEKRGHQAGSWHFRDHYGDVGGRLYTTAMAAMILEVYYRYLPLYDQAEFPL